MYGDCPTNSAAIPCPKEATGEEEILDTDDQQVDTLRDPTRRNLRNQRDDLELPKVKLISAKPGQRITLECRVQKTKANYARMGRANLSWSAPLNDKRFFVDRLFRLNIEVIDFNASETNYSCLVNGNASVIYLLTVSAYIPVETFNSALAYSGVYFILTSLVLVIIISFWIDPKDQMTKKIS